VRVLLSDCVTGGGLSSHCVLLGRELVARGHEVTAHLATAGPRSSSWERTGVRLVPGGQVLDLLLSERFDVVNLSDADLSRLGRSAVAASRSPVVLTVHPTRPAVRVRGVDHVVFVSPAQQGLTRLRGGSPPTTVIPNAIDMRRFGCDGPVEGVGHRPVALWVGRVADRQKDVDAYLAAVGRLGPTWTPMICTDASRRGDTEAFCSGHPDLRVVSRSWEDMPALLRGVARGGGCLVMSSRQEGDPLVVGEALACGLPVAAVRIPALDGWIGTGALAVADDRADLAEAVIDACGPDRRRRLATAAVELQGARSVDRWVDAFEQVYDEASRCRRPALRRWVAGQRSGQRRLDALVNAGGHLPVPDRGPPSVGSGDRLEVVVTSYCRPVALAGCLDGIAGLADPVAAVCVVDNSPDPLPTTRPAGLRDATRFEVVADGVNRGLPAALGRAFDRLRDCDEVLVLDDDTVPTTDLVRALSEALRCGAGAAGLADPYTVRHNGAGPPRLLPWSPSLLRRALIDDLVAPEARLFFGHDDYDYCLRAERAGWPIAWVDHRLAVQRLGEAWPGRRYFAARNSVWLATRRWPPAAPLFSIAAATVRSVGSLMVALVRPGVVRDATARRTTRAGLVGLGHGLVGRMGPPPAWVMADRSDPPSAA